MRENIANMINILSEFLGKPKSDYIDLNSNLCFEFNCPKCAEENGYIQDNKYNLSITLSKGGGIFQCWRCSTHSDEMKGKIKKLFKMYGNEQLWQEYKSNLLSIHESDLYKLNFSKEDFKLNEEEKNELNLPFTYHKFNFNYKTIALEYLKERGIDETIIKKHNIGYTTWDNSKPFYSNRIIIPSYDKYGDLNYWVGRDFIGKSKMKYANPNVEKKNIIFGENRINWDNDIILCEGVFDSIVLPNSIPLLGKSITKDYKLYDELFNKANGKIILFLDGDEPGKLAVKTIYKNLNHGKLYDRIKYVKYSDSELDPSEIFKKYGRKGIISYIRKAEKIKPYLLPI